MKRVIAPLEKINRSYLVTFLSISAFLLLAGALVFLPPPGEGLCGFPPAGGCGFGGIILPYSTRASTAAHGTRRPCHIHTAGRVWP